MAMMASAIKDVHTLQKRYYPKAVWPQDREGKKRIRSAITILAEKQLLHEISQILRSPELPAITDERVPIVTRRSPPICRVRAREYPAYERRGQTHPLHGKLTHQLHRKGGGAQWVCTESEWRGTRHSQVQEVMKAQMTEEDEVFGNYKLGFPTDRRPKDYRRPIATAGTPEGEKWLLRFPDLLGPTIETDEERQKASLLFQTWRDLFVEDVREMPATDLIEHYIPTYANTIPVVAKPVLYTAEEIDWMKANLPALVEAGIIAPCQSPWSARSRFPRKSNGTLRMVHVFCQLNDATIKANYPMRRLEPILKGAAQPALKHFFQADAANGFWAIKVYRPHAYKLGFAAYNGHYCYLRMGQGITGGPGTYSRLKDIVTGPIPTPDAEPPLTDASSSFFDHFVDDDVGGARTFEDMFQFLHEHYFPRLKWARLTLNPKKCKFFVPRIQILGHQRDVSGIRPSEDKLRAFREWPSPQSKAELDRFLYMLPFLKNYIPGRADKSTLLKTAMVEEVTTSICAGKKRTRRKVVDFIWTSEHETIFRDIKESILKNACAGGDDQVQWHLATDASKTGAGGVLFQLPDHPPGTAMTKETRDSMKIVMFLSFAFTPPQTRYQTTEREALAVVKNLAEIRWLVQGSKLPIKLYTDHQALLKCLQSEDMTGRLARWQLALSEFNLDIVHVAGKDLAIADGLSRLSNPPSATPSSIEVPLVAFTAEGFQLTEGTQVPRENDWEEWLDDPWYADVVEAKITGDCRTEGFLSESSTRIAKRKSDKYILVDGEPKELAYRERNGKLARCLHEPEVPKVLILLHNVHGHFAEGITLRRAIGRFFWPTRHKDITEFCKTCANCQMTGPLRPSQGLLPIVSLQPLDVMGIDFIGPITPIAKSGARFMCISVDYFTRYLFADAMPSATSGNTVIFFERSVVQNFGWPRMVYSDNGSHFKGNFDSKLKEQKVKHYFAPISHPASVGLAERYVRIVLEVFRAILQHHVDMIFEWDRLLPAVVKAINTRMIRAFGHSPAELLLGYQPKYFAGDDLYDNVLRSQALEDKFRELLESEPAVSQANLVVDSTMGIEERNFEERLAKLDEMRDLALDKRMEMGEDIAQKTAKGKGPLEPGDLVKLRRLGQDQQKSHKLEPKWEGPYIVQSVSTHKKSVWLEDLNTGETKGRYHVNAIALFVPRRTYTDQTQSWKTVSEINSQIRADVRTWMKKRTADRKAEMHSLGKDSYEEELDTDTPDRAWWETASGFPSEGYGDEAEWNYWRRKGVAIDLQTLIEKGDEYMETLMAERLEVFAAQDGALGSASGDA